jgi:5-bromo-4-chloroindolyl phosphate hydrolysis protein
VSKKSKGINPELETSINELLKSVMSDPTASLTDKCKVVDRALNLEKIKQKISDDEWGSGLAIDEEQI